MSTNRFFNTIMIVALVVVLGFTIREALATTSVVGANPDAAAVEEMERMERARSADTARWNAQAEAYRSIESLEAERALRSQHASTARLNALADSFKAKQGDASERSQRAWDAAVARWNAQVAYYLSR